MDRYNYLGIEKLEWERLLDQANPPKANKKNGKAKESKALAEKSQKWIKSWPDTDEGHVKQYLKRKEQRRLQEITAVKQSERKKKEWVSRMTNEAITRARQMIFEDSCYGRELISALLESKAIEERELQIELKKETTQKELELEQQLEAKATRYIDFDKEHEEMARRRKERTIECAKININTHRCRLIEENTTKQDKIKMELKDARCMKELLDNEKEEEKKWQASAIQALKEQEVEQKRVKEYRAIREKVDDDVAEVWRAYFASRRSKEKKVLDDIHKDKHQKQVSKKNYDLVQMLQNETDKQYEDFINKGVDKLEKIEKSKLQEEKATAIRKQKERLELAEQYKNQRKIDPVPMDRMKHFCLKQSLFTNSEKAGKDFKKCFKVHKPTFLSQPTTLRDQLIQRAKEPSPWNGTRSAHINFAVGARGLAAQCKHNHGVRRVVDVSNLIKGYRKSNNLDKNTLPVFDEEIEPFLPKKQD